MKFELTEKQVQRISNFHKTHKKKYTGAIGGGETYSFTPTSLGLIVEYKCKCGKQIDVTDHFSW